MLFAARYFTSCYLLAALFACNVIYLQRYLLSVLFAAHYFAFTTITNNAVGK